MFLPYQKLVYNANCLLKTFIKNSEHGGVLGGNDGGSKRVVVIMVRN